MGQVLTLHLSSGPARFITVSFKPLTDQDFGRYHRFSCFNICLFFQHKKVEICNSIEQETTDEIFYFECGKQRYIMLCIEHATLKVSRVTQIMSNCSLK